ncbi:MAG TPA: histidine kinase dimerization/phospho-acceptor domain-containing protein, partial [Longimicrobiales bacterium]|nr:histidine kinase dimerization/phospho-acceptor domain-containing protein [Longimicrobiales bacterium]
MSDLSPHGITRSAPHADAGLLTGLLRDPPQATAPSTSLLHLLFERCADPLALLDGDLRLVRVNDALVQLFSGNWGGRAAGLAGLLQAHERPPRLERALRTGVAELAVPLGPDGQLVADAHPIVEEGGGARMVLAFRPEPPSAPDPPHLLPLGRALARSGSRADVCQALLDDARARGAAAAVFLPMPNGHSLQMAAQEGYAEPVVEIFRVIELTEPLPATEVFRHGEPLYIGSAGEWERHFGPACGFRPAGPSASAAVLPLPGADDVLGVLAHSYPGARTFTAAERATLELVGSMAGAALRRLDLEERAAAARRAKADFLGILSHEFRTPLSAILGYIDLVESAEGERLTERQADRLGRARRSAWHLTELVDGMLQLARMEKGLEACQPRRVDVAELVRDAVGLFEQPARAKGLALGVSGADAPVHIATDAAK